MSDEVRLIWVTGPEKRLDQDIHGQPLNPLPAKCPTCGFPDLNFVSQPYYVTRSRATTVAEILIAEVGNLLVRPRARAVIEHVSPSTCAFYTTRFRNSDEPSEWSLAVPVATVDTGRIKASVPRCEECGEPISGYYGSQYDHRPWQPVGVDIAKSRNWMSGERGWQLSISRQHLMSVRLYQLLKKLKIRGIEQVGVRDTRMNAREGRWVRGIQAELLAAEQM